MIITYITHEHKYTYIQLCTYVHAYIHKNLHTYLSTYIHTHVVKCTSTHNIYTYAYNTYMYILFLDFHTLFVNKPGVQGNGSVQ